MSWEGLVQLLSMDEKIEELLKRGTDRIYPSPEFLVEQLKFGRKLRVYLGLDPTGPMQLHHTIPLRKLRHFQNLGHHVIFLIGSFTAMIGDPTGKSKARVPLTKEQVVANARDYAQLARGVLDFENNPPEIVFNGDWLEKLTFREVVELASHFTVQQMIERDMFQKRLQEGLPISLHEFLYPLMQGYDSVAIDCDVEVGGTDQTFNMLTGRALLKDYKGKEKIVVSVPLLTDESGKKTSTSDGTGVSLDLSPNDLYGKVMSLPDSFLGNMYILCTDMPMEEIDQILHNLSKGANPMPIKKNLAKLITQNFHGQQAAALAQMAFENTVQGGALPEEIPEIEVPQKRAMIRDLLVEIGLCSSNAEAKRMVEENAVSVYINNEERKVTNPKEELELLNGMIVRVGKRRLVKIKIK